MAEELSIRPATPDDARFYWEVNNEAAVRSQSVQTASIPWDTHATWFKASLESPARALYVSMMGDEPAGVVRFDFSHGIATISVALSPHFRGRGLGVSTIRRGCQTVLAGDAVTTVEAFVRPSNEASLAAFERAGFRHAETTRIDGVDLHRLVWEPER